MLAKFFDRKGPSGWYSQAWMSRADPVVEQGHAEQVVLGLLDRDRLALRVRPADDEAELELEVEPSAGRQQLGRRAFAAAPLRRPAGGSGSGSD